MTETDQRRAGDNELIDASIAGQRLLPYPRSCYPAARGGQ